MHLLLGDPDDPCCAGVLARMEAHGSSARALAAPLATPARLVWRLDDDGAFSRYTCPGGTDDTRIESVLVRNPGWLDPAGWDPGDHAYVQSELHATLLAWLASLPCPVVNRCSAALWYQPRKPLLAWRPLLRRVGLPAAECIVTNDPAESRDFARRVAAGGIVLTPLTGGAGYLVGSESDWRNLALLQEHAPVCLSEPHGPVRPACVVAGQVVWDEAPEQEARALEPNLCRFAEAAALEFLEVAVAPLRRGLAVVMADPRPELEHFGPSARERILDALVARLMQRTTHASAAAVRGR
jgi:hypothetical protein